MSKSPTTIHELALLPLPEVARVLAISIDTVHALVKSGRLRSVVLGRHRRVPRAALQAFVDGRTG